MELEFSTVILEQRKKRNLTQEELAMLLGVSAQAVSNWERGGYPDITMLPNIANYFGITIDELLGNDKNNQREDIKRFFDRYFALERVADREEQYHLALEYARKYPHKYGIATLAARAITELPAEMRKKQFPTLRQLCERVINEATHQGVRNLAIKIMCSECADEEADKWFAMCPVQYNVCLNEVKEERLWQQGKYEESRMQYDVNNIRIFRHFLFRQHRNAGCMARLAEQSAFRLQMLEFIADGGPIPEAWCGHYANEHFRLASAFFGSGRKDEAYACLEQALVLVQRWLAIPNDTPLDLGAPYLFGKVKIIKGKALILLPDGSFQHSQFESGFSPLSFYECMTKSCGWECFDAVREETRFKELVARAKEVENK